MPYPASSAADIELRPVAQRGLDLLQRVDETEGLQAALVLLGVAAREAQAVQEKGWTGRARFHGGPPNIGEGGSG